MRPASVCSSVPGHAQGSLRRSRACVLLPVKPRSFCNWRVRTVRYDGSWIADDARGGFGAQLTAFEQVMWPDTSLRLGTHSVWAPAARNNRLARGCMSCLETMGNDPDVAFQQRYEAVNVSTRLESGVVKDAIVASRLAKRPSCGRARPTVEWHVAAQLATPLGFLTSVFKRVRFHALMGEIAIPSCRRDGEPQNILIYFGHVLARRKSPRVGENERTFGCGPELRDRGCGVQASSPGEGLDPQLSRGCLSTRGVSLHVTHRSHGGTRPSCMRQRAYGSQRTPLNPGKIFYSSAFALDSLHPTAKVRALTTIKSTPWIACVPKWVAADHFPNVS